MTAEKSLAIVLRVVEFSETSCIVTLFTDDFGRISALAKGARRPKGPFESAIDLLAMCRIVFLRKSGDVLDLLTEAKLERRFRAAGRDLTRYYAGCYVAELLLAWTEDRDPNRKLFTLAVETITRLDDDAPVAQTILRFEIRGLHLLGLLPALHRCVECGTDITGGRRVAFGVLAGGALCDQCKRGQRNVISLSSDARTAMQQLAEPTHTAAPPPPERVWGELRGVMNHVISHQMERRPRLFPYISRLSHHA